MISLRFIFLSLVIGIFSCNVRAGRDPFASSSSDSSSRGFESSSNRISEDEVVTKYSLLDPNMHRAALEKATADEAEALKLEKQGKYQISSEDFVSPFDGKVTSREGVRENGRRNLDLAVFKKNEATALREGVAKIRRDLDRKASLPPALKIHDLNGINGTTIHAQIIDSMGAGIIIRRSDGEYFSILPDKLSASSAEYVRGCIRSRNLAVAVEKMSPIKKLHLEGFTQEVNLMVERNKSILIRDAEGSVSEIPFTFPEGSFMTQIQKDMDQLEVTIAAMKKKELEEIAPYQGKLNALYLRVGQPQSFVVERILSFSRFPLEKYGEYIYQVRIGRNPAILVTRQTQYLTTGRGILFLKSIGNYDVSMMDGSERTVPAMVEVDQETIDEAHDLQAKINDVRTNHVTRRDATASDLSQAKKRLNDHTENMRLFLCAMGDAPSVQ